MSYKTHTLCWDCGRAGACSWSRGIPVEGWTAEKHIINGTESERRVESFTVLDCPEYESFVKIDPCDEGIENLAAAIIRNSVWRLNKAMQRERGFRKDPAQLTKRKLYGTHHRKLYGHKKVPAVIDEEETFLRSEWAEMLSNGLDAEAIIEAIRKRHGFTKGEKI